MNTKRIAGLAGLLCMAGSASADRGWWHEHGCASCQRAAWLAAHMRGFDADGFDEATGKSTLVYPHHRPIDILHQRIEITIHDMDVPVAAARTVIDFEPRANGLERFELDSVLLEIHGVTIDGQRANWTADGEKLAIDLPMAIARGERAQAIIDYTIRDPRRGLTWTPSSEDWPNRPAQIHTQGQPQDNSSWFPTHDFPNEKMTTELVVAVPQGFLVSGNGRLEERRPSTATAPDGVSVPVEVFRWLQEPEHPAYLVSLIVGKFDVVDVGDGTVPMPVYVPPGRAGDVVGTYGDTLAMTRVYERLFDEPYPWDRYAQLVVWNFDAGGMENTAATTMFDTAIIAQDELDDHNLIGLIAHEVAHQWFGNLVTCASWEHLWLNEGFATYLESIWLEESGGREAYLVDTLANFDSVIRRDTGTAPGTPAMASAAYLDPLDTFRKSSNPYPKGASVLHMLRTKLGDDAFFGGLATYLDLYKHSTAETGDLMDVLEDASGESLERFFDQWVMRPGIPRLDIKSDWSDGVLSLRIEQTQPIDGNNPAFWFDLPITIDAGGQSRQTSIAVREHTTEVELPVEIEPAMVAFDPELAVLAELSISQPEAWWRTQLAGGPTLPSRVQAARHLAEIATRGETDTAAEALAAAGRDVGQPVRVRVAAVRGLGTRSAATLAASFLSDANWEVRRAAARAIGDLEQVPGDAARTLAALARSDRSTRVRSAAIAALASTQDARWADLLIELTGVESQHDGVRQAALRGLAEIGPEAGERALDVALRFSRFGTLNRTRPAAVAAIESLAELDRDRAITRLIELLDDREHRTVTAAGAALASLGGDRARRALDMHRAQQRDIPLQRQADAWLSRLDED